MKQVFEHLYRFLLGFRSRPARLEEMNSYAAFNPMEKALCKDLVRNLLFLEYTGKNYIRRFNKFPHSFQALFITGSFEILLGENLSPAEIIAPVLNISDTLSFNKDLKRILHGALGRISREKQNILQVQYPLSIQYSYPEPAYRVLNESIPSDKFPTALQALHHPPPGIGFSFNPGQVDRYEFMEFLKTHDCVFTEYSSHPHYVHVQKGTERVLSSPYFQDGLLYVQDPAMALVTRYASLPVDNDASILDYCAAPGGKTISLAQELHAKNPLFICHDVSFNRLCQLRKNLLSRPWINAIIITGNPERCDRKCSPEEFRRILQNKIIPPELRGRICHIPAWEENCKGQFDAVIVDAPCSGLGTISKYPEIKYLFNDDKQFIQIQKKLLEKTEEFVKIHGLLYYLTCTLNQRENEDVVRSLQAVETRKWEPLVGENISRDGCLTVFPGEDFHSGGFMAGMRRRSQEKIDCERA